MVLVNHLNTLDVATSTALIICGLKSLSYAIAANIVSRIAKKINYKLMIDIAILTGALANICQGPEIYIYLPNKDYMCILGLFLNGVATAMILIPNVPELLGILSELFPGEHNVKNRSEMAAGCYFSAY
jgi:hypothetical protein